MSSSFEPNRETNKVVDIKIEKIKKQFFKFLPIVTVIFILIIIALNSFYIIENKENGVVLRFGKIQGVETRPGINFKLPFIDKVRKVDVRTIYNMEYGFRTSQPGDSQSIAKYDDQDEESKVIVDGANNNASIALVELIIQYRIKDPINYLFKVDDVEGTLNLALEDVVRTTMQSFTLDDAKTQKELIDKEIKPRLQATIDGYETGIEIVLVGTQNVQFLPSVETAYQQKENANQYKNGKKEDAEKYKNTVIPQANAEATRLIEDANAYRANVLAQANAGVAEFNALYEKYQSNKNILLEQYYIEAMNQFLSKNKVIIDFSKTDNLYKFYNLEDNKKENSIKQNILQEDFNLNKAKEEDKNEK